MVTESPTGYGGIVRADLADLLVGAAASPLATGKTFTAVDRTKYVDGRAAPRGSAGGKTRPAATAAAAAAPPRLNAHAGWGGARAALVHGGDRGVAVVRGEFWLLRVEWRAQFLVLGRVLWVWGDSGGGRERACRAPHLPASLPVGSGRRVARNPTLPFGQPARTHSQPATAALRLSPLSYRACATYSPPGSPPRFAASVTRRRRHPLAFSTFRSLPRPCPPTPWCSPHRVLLTSPYVRPLEFWEELPFTPFSLSG